MIDLIHEKNGGFYDAVISGKNSLNDAYEKFAQMMGDILRSHKSPKVTGVLSELDNAWIWLISVEKETGRHADLMALNSEMAQ